MMYSIERKINGRRIENGSPSGVARQVVCDVRAGVSSGQISVLLVGTSSFFVLVDNFLF